MIFHITVRGKVSNKIRWVTRMNCNSVDYCKNSLNSEAPIKLKSMDTNARKKQVKRKKHKQQCLREDNHSMIPINQELWDGKSFQGRHHIQTTKMDTNSFLHFVDKWRHGLSTKICRFPFLLEPPTQRCISRKLIVKREWNYIVL